MRGKPNPPKRYSYSRTVSINSGDTLEKVLANLEEAGAKPSEARFQMRQTDSYYDCNACHGSYSDDCELIYTALEDKEIFELRLASYRKRLASWEEWAGNHKEEIEAYLVALAEKKKGKLARRAERARKSLESEEKSLEKRLRGLKKRLQK